MSKHLSLRWLGSIAAIVTGFLLAGGHLLEETTNAETWIMLAKNMIFLAHLAMAFAFIAIYDSHSNKNVWGAAGMLLATAGTIFVTAIVFVETASITMPDATALLDGSGVSWITGTGPLLFVLGIVMVGAELIIRGEKARAGGVLLVMGTILFASAEFIGVFAPVSILTGSALTGAGFIWLGIHINKAEEQQVSESTI
ncbi:hypothetical protein [Brevibacillus reuszeri]|uniref:hypothetical protein n=1 Tax=Brevibacillus reuszeri TaxID=54915 RepID=UPI0028976C92|nr:hypothetical protein [Brevibacillus reuszeri]